VGADRSSSSNAFKTCVLISVAPLRDSPRALYAIGSIRIFAPSRSKKSRQAAFYELPAANLRLKPDNRRSDLKPQIDRGAAFATGALIVILASSDLLETFPAIELQRGLIVVSDLEKDKSRAAALEILQVFF